MTTDLAYAVVPSELQLLLYFYSVCRTQGEIYGEILIYPNICTTYRTTAEDFPTILNGIFLFTIHTEDI